MSDIKQEYLDELFPATRTDEFFEALFGDKEDGAYDIRLTLASQDSHKVELVYELHGRPGKCLACNLTSGLPHVLTRHPIIAAQKTADAIAQKMQWEKFTFTIGTTRQISDSLHTVPFTLSQVN